MLFKKLICLSAQLLFRLNKHILCLSQTAEHGTLGDQDIHRPVYIGFKYPLQASPLSHNTVFPKIPCKEDAFSGNLNVKHVGIQGRVIYIEGKDPNAGKGCDPLSGFISAHPFHRRETFFLCPMVHIRNKDTQDVFCQRADVHGNIVGNLLKKAIVIAVVMGK